MITFFLLNIKTSVSVVEHLGQTSFTTQYSVTWFSFLTQFHSFHTSLPNPPHTCLNLEGFAVIAAAVLVGSRDAEGVGRPAFQIRHVAGRGSAGAAGVVTFGLLGQHHIAAGSIREIPRHPGRVCHTVQAAVGVPGHTRSWRREKHGEKKDSFVCIVNKMV